MPLFRRSSVHRRLGNLQKSMAKPQNTRRLNANIIKVNELADKEITRLAGLGRFKESAVLRVKANEAMFSGSHRIAELMNIPMPPEIKRANAELLKETEHIKRVLRNSHKMTEEEVARELDKV